MINNKKFSIKAIFLDRDRTIVEEPGSLRRKNTSDADVDSISKLHILPNAIKGLKKMINMGYTIFIITNQDAINRGTLTIELYNKIENILTDKFGKHGITIEKWLFCPHTSEEICTCRKPKTGLIDSLKGEYDIDFVNSYVIGDRESDLLLAEKLKMTGILVKRNEKEIEKTRAKFIAENIYDACRFIKIIKNK